MIVERSPLSGLSVASEICDVEDVDDGGTSGDSRDRLQGRSITQLNEFEMIDAGDVPRSIREGDVGTDDRVDAEVGCGRVTDMSGTEYWVPDWS